MLQCPGWPNTFPAKGIVNHVNTWNVIWHLHVILANTILKPDSFEVLVVNIMSQLKLCPDLTKKIQFLEKLFD